MSLISNDNRIADSSNEARLKSLSYFSLRTLRTAFNQNYNPPPYKKKTKKKRAYKSEVNEIFHNCCETQ